MGAEAAEVVSEKDTQSDQTPKREAADRLCVASMTSLNLLERMNELSDGVIRPFNATKEGRMNLWRLALALAIAILAADLVSAAPDGKIVIAQGTDPSTLDMTNHQETPAANVGAQIFETLVERDENLQPVPGLAAELPRAISPTQWEIRLR